MAFQDINYEVVDGTASIVISRPEVLNAMRFETIVELRTALLQAADDPTVGVVVISGVGGKAFSAGGDQKELVANMNPQTWRPVARAFLELFGSIRSCPVPVVAAVQGWAIGGGNELHTYCDLTLATESSTFGQVGAKVGSLPLYVTQILPRTVGDKRAKEILFLCNRYTAHEAQELGLVNFVVPDADFEAEVKALCESILDKSPTALRFLKMGVNHGQALDEQHVEFLVELAATYFGSDEQREGHLAYQEKRDPNFRKFRQALDAAVDH